MLKTKYAHVLINPNGIPVVGKTQVPVAQLALEVVMIGLSPQELQLFLHPHLTLGEIYAALGFFFDKYYDERPTVKDQIEQLRSDVMLPAPPAHIVLPKC
jgi:uncharacterized protein (DUF433 family)